MLRVCAPPPPSRSFCEAMIKIRGEIADIEAGRLPRDNNPLVNAPHPASVVLAEQWDRWVGNLWGILSTVVQTRSGPAGVQGHARVAGPGLRHEQVEGAGLVGVVLAEQCDRWACWGGQGCTISGLMGRTVTHSHSGFRIIYECIHSLF